MSTIRTSADLDKVIHHLEIQCQEDGEKIKNQFSDTYQGLSAINILKGAFKEASDSKELKERLVNGIVGLFVGYFTRTLFIGKSNNPFKKLMGSVLLFGITNFIAKSPGVVGNVGKMILKLIGKNTRNAF